jgi:hypothetical protein
LLVNNKFIIYLNFFHEKNIILLGFFTHEKLKYPFSLSFMLNSLLRVYNRKDHETLPEKSFKSLGIFFDFLVIFRNKNLTLESLSK